MFYRVALLFLIVVAALGCKGRNMTSKIPVIKFVGINPTMVNSGDPNDTLIIVFKIKDGDGDLGNAGNPNFFDIYLRDVRFDSVSYQPFPGFGGLKIDEDYGIEGDCYVFLNTASIKVRKDGVHDKRDTTQFEIYVQDQAGNISNQLVTDQIVILD